MTSDPQVAPTEDELRTAQFLHALAEREEAHRRVKQNLLTHKPSKLQRRMRAALEEHFGPAHVRPDVEHPDTFRVYYRREQTRLCIVVTYEPDEGQIRVALGEQSWTTRIQENSRAAWSNRSREIFVRVRTEAKARERERLDREKIEKRIRAKERAAWRVLIAQWEREFQRAQRKGRPWYIGGQCSRAQYRFEGLGACSLTPRAPCEAVPDVSDIVPVRLQTRFRCAHPHLVGSTAVCTERLPSP